MNLVPLHSVAHDVLQVLWRSSWQAAVLAGVVLAVQWLFRARLSARWRYALWLLVLMRLLLPVTPQSPMSVFNLSQRLTPPPVLPAAIEVDHLPPAVSPSVSDAARAVSPIVNTPPAPPAAAPVCWPCILLSVWLIGLTVLLSRIAWASVRLARRVRRMPAVDDEAALGILAACCGELGVRRKVAMLAADDLPAPALMGVIRPRLLLPRHVLETFAPHELRLILLHELGHLKRNDVLVNWLVALLQAVHWFNPVLWFAFARLRADRELATDELVLQRTGDAERNAYGDTILKLLQSLTATRRPAPMAGAVGILEHAHTLRRRITMIAQFRRTHATHWTMAAAAGMLLLAGVGLTDAVHGQNPSPASALPAAEKTAAPATTRPADAKLNALIEDVLAKALKKNSPPTAADIEAAMNELGERIQNENLIFDSQGQPANEPQVKQRIDAASRRLGELAKLRTTTTGAPASRVEGAVVPAATAAALKKLSEPMAEVNFADIPFVEAIEFLRQTSGLNVFVNWRALEAAGVDRAAPISLNLKNVPYELALRYILRDAAGGAVVLDFAVIDGVVNISTEEDLARDVKVRVYDIQALLAQLPLEFTPADPAAVAGPGADTRIQKVINTIIETIAPDSWRDSGGTIGQIRELNGRLVISQTEANHAAIAKLLSELTANPAAAAANPFASRD